METAGTLRSANAKYGEFPGEAFFYWNLDGIFNNKKLGSVPALCEA